LIKLKNFMLNLETWNIRIYINLNWKEIDTKISLSQIDKLKDWELNNFK
jgi:hypothetical protein